MSVSYCFAIGIAGGIDSKKSALADALCEAYSHRPVIHLKMEDYRKPVEELPFATLQNGDRIRDEYSPDAYDLAKMQEDIADIMWNKRCRILVVEGAYILWHNGIEELCDARVYTDGLSDVDATESASFNDVADIVRDHHIRCVAPSKAEADIPILIDDDAERGVWKIKKALWGLWL